MLGDDAQVEEEVRVDVVEETPGGAVLVGEESMVLGGVDREVLPHGFVFDGGCGEIGGVGGVVGQGGDFAHGGEGDNPFGGEVGLIGELTGEVVYGRRLVLGMAELRL